MAAASSRKARCRSLAGMETPAAFTYCRRGLPVNLTPDLFEHLPNFKALQQPIAELFSMGCVGGSSGSMKQVFKIRPDQKVYSTTWDPMCWVYGTTNDKSISLDTSKGRVQVDCKKFMELILKCKPDIVALMSDRHTNHSSQGRVRKSVTRTLKWTQECLDQFKDHEKTTKTEQKSGYCPCFLGVIEGGTIREQRGYCASQITKIDGLSGYVIAGLGCGESVSERQDIYKEICAKIPEDKAIVVTSIVTPLRVLEAISYGLDVFEGGYPWTLTQLGCAASFLVDPTFTASEKKEEIINKKSASKINLWDPVYKTDASVLVDGCQCYTCKTHSKAYVHHLLNTHEMLAQVLLQLHNVYHYQRFFEQIRVHTKRGRFGEYREWFETAFD